jgi:hypothetical protein
MLSGGGASEIHGEGHLERSYELDERTRDADLDMVLHFRAADTGLKVGDTEACEGGVDRCDKPHARVLRL